MKLSDNQGLLNLMQGCFEFNVSQIGYIKPRDYIFMLGPLRMVDFKPLIKSVIYLLLPDSNFGFYRER